MALPHLTPEERAACLQNASESSKHRFPKILHQPGDFTNAVINFVLSASYMQPHLHPGAEKVEEIWLLEGKMAVIFFDDQGMVTSSVILEKDQGDHIKIPAFAWHTYVTLSDHSISYETMDGVYDPATWKEFATWAPAENTPKSATYLDQLKQVALEEANG